METFIQKWGYLAVLLASMIEGESVILPAGYFAAQGELSLPKIMLISFLGSLFADQFLFFVGQRWGKRALEKAAQNRPKLDAVVQKSFSFLHQNKRFYILTFRFIYGVRIMSPVVIGAANVSFKEFATLNIIAAALWAFLSCGAGYVFGGFLINYLSSTQRFFVLGVLGGISALWLCFKAYKFFRRNPES